MARFLFVGRAGTGKTRACLDRLTEALRGGRRALLLVPTYAQAEHLRTRLLDRTGGLSEHTVVTFEALAEKAAGVRLHELVQPAVRDRVAARVLAEVFPEASRQAGFRVEFLRVVKEIKEQGVPLDRALEQARAHFPKNSRGRLLFEACARYADAMPGPDHEDLLLRTRDHLAAKPDLFLVDGFHDFTPVQREIVFGLAARSKETVVTLPLDPDDPGHPIFRTASATAALFEGFERVFFRENRRAAPPLAGLEARLFRPPGERLAADGIEVIACPSEEDEADRVARLVARAGRPLNEILLVRRSFEDCRPAYRAAFRRHGIPLRFYGPEPLGGTPAARAVTLWLRTLVGPVPPADQLPLLRSTYFLQRPKARAVDELARRLRRGEEIDLPELAAPEGPLGPALRRRFGLRDALVETPDGDFDLALAACTLRAIFKEADALDRDLPAAEAAVELLRRIPGLKGSVRDRRHHCVYAVEALDARQWEQPLVIVTGLTTDAFPRQHRQDLFLRDDERRRFAEERDVRLPLRARREEDERYLFYVALTRARERLVCTYPAFDEDGVPRPPSPYLEEALEHLDLAPRKIPLAEQYVPAGDATRRADVLPIVSDGLSRAHRGEGALAAALYDRKAVPRPVLAWPRRLALWRLRPIPGLALDRLELSASGINDFRRCPYLFLMRKVLRVRKPRDEGLDPLLRGTIVHEALETIHNTRRDPEEVFDEVFLERAGAFRFGLREQAARRWMRAVVKRAGDDILARPPGAAESTFERPLADGVVLHGKIDRVDPTPAGDLVRDYKTGSPRKAALDSLEDIQLDVYLLALDNPAGAVYEVLRHGRSMGYVVEELAAEFRGQAVDVVTREELDGRRARMRGIADEVAAAARAGRLAVRPRDAEKCTRTDCDGYDLCRVARARFLARGGD